GQSPTLDALHIEEVLDETLHVLERSSQTEHLPAAHAVAELIGREVEEQFGVQKRRVERVAQIVRYHAERTLTRGRLSPGLAIEARVVHRECRATRQLRHERQI